MGLDAASGGVGGDGCSSVARRVFDYLVDAKLSGDGEHYGSASVFERAGRGGELELGVEGGQAEGVGDSGQGDDGRVSFAEGDGGCIEDGFRIRGISHDEWRGALLAAQGTHVGGVVSGAGGASEGVGVHGICVYSNSRFHIIRYSSRNVKTPKGFSVAQRGLR